MLTPAVAALIALLPAAVVWWRSRNLVRLVDDPVLPERLLATRTQNGVVLGICVPVLVFTMPEQSIWAMPLLVVARMCAGYPLRKAIYRETWNLAGYLSFFSRLIVAVFGFWILLAATPWLVSLAGTRDWIAAGVMAAVLIVWSAMNVRIFRAALRARPVDDPAIVARFTEMVKACALPDVVLEQVDLHGGVFANAVALPSTRDRAVLVSSTLVERLDRDETVAILAHELAHIEHYHPGRLRRMGAMLLSIIAITALLAMLLRLVLPAVKDVVIATWPLVVVVAMMAMGRRRQKYETASDLRAIALAGDPAALIRALTKLHAFAHLPRRWDLEFEQTATHPSLARRIQAIQAAAGTAPAPLAEPATFVATDGTTSVVFHEDHVVWTEGAASSHAIEYARLTMLRIATKASDVPRLVAVDTAHRRWEMILQPADVARAQATLDIVDTRLGAVARRPAASVAVLRILAIAALMAAATLDQAAAMFVAMLAVILPAVPLAAAAGAAAIGAAAIVLRDHGFGGIDWRPWAALASLVIGASLLSVSVARRREPATPTARRLVFVLAVATVAVWALVALLGLSSIELHRSVRAWPSAALLMLSLGGALAFAPSRAARRASAPLVAAGLAAVFVGSIAFLDRSGSDPFLGSSGSVAVRTIDLSAARDEFEVPFVVSEMSLSPAGRYATFASEDQNEEITIHAGPMHGPWERFAADQAVFVDEGRLLLVDSQRGASTLRVVDLEHGAREAWSRQVPFFAEHVSVDRASMRWQLLGWNADRDIVSVTGSIGSDAVSEESWKRHTADGAFVRPLAVANGLMLGLEMRSPALWRQSVTMVRFAMLIQPEYHYESRLWSIRREGASAFATSHLDLRCPHQSPGDERPMCAAFDGTRTGIYAVDPATRQLTPLASMTGRFFPRGGSGGGWMSGWWEHAPALVHPAKRAAVRVAGENCEAPDQLAMAQGIVGGVWTDANKSTVRFYSFD